MNELNDPQSSTPLHPIPMTFGQILDRTYRLMRAHFRLLFGIAAVPASTMLLVIGAVLWIMFTVLMPRMTGKPPGIGAVASGIPAWFPLITLPLYLVIVLIYALFMPAASFAATQADRGVTVSLRQAYGAAWSRFGRYLWLMILCALCVMVPVIVVGGLVAGGAVFLTGVKSNPASAFFLIPLLVLIYIGIFVYSIVIMLRLAVVYPAGVEEGLSAWTAVRRSVNLTRNAMGRIFLVLLVIYAIAYAVELAGILVLFVLAALVGFIAFAAHVTVGSPAFFILIGMGGLGYLLVILVFIMLCYSALTTAMAVLYHDQRLRKDGLAGPESSASTAR